MPRVRRNNTRGTVRIHCIIVAVAFSAIADAASAQQVRAITLQPANAKSSSGFTRISSVRELSDGRLLISDMGENRIVAIDWRSSSITDAGRRGDGPGEFQTVGWLYPLRGDTSILTDAQSRRWHLLVGSQIRLSLDGRRRQLGILDQFISGTDVRSRFLAVDGYVFNPAFPFNSGATSADSLLVLLAEGAATEDAPTRLDTIARIAGRGCFPGAVAGSGTDRPRGLPARPVIPPCSPLATEELPWLFPDGWVAIALKSPYRVDWRQPDGRWIRGAAIPVPTQRITDRDRCAALRQFPFRALADCDATQLAALPWPQTLPPFFRHMATRPMTAANSSMLFATPEGQLLVRRTPNADQSGNRYDLVDRSGKLVATISMPANEAVIGFGAQSIYTISIDDSDLEWVRRHPWSEPR